MAGTDSYPRSNKAAESDCAQFRGNLGGTHFSQYMKVGVNRLWGDLKEAAGALKDESGKGLSR